MRKQKAKGRYLQKILEGKLLGLFPKLKPDDVRSTPMGLNGEDILLSPAARKSIPVQFECKNYSARSVPVYDFYDQAKAHGKHEPVVVYKKPHKKPLAIVDLDHYLDLLKTSGSSTG